MQTKLAVNIGKLKLKNPVMVASGTFGYAQEFKDFMDLKSLGAIVTKTITVRPRRGNPAPRTCETPAGLLNSIGLENPGVNEFIKDKIPFLLDIGTPIIVSIASEKNADEFMVLTEKLNKIKQLKAFELNISCPNVKDDLNRAQSKALISQDPQATYNLIRKVRKATDRVIITKLSPNVSSISEIAIAAEKGGSDAISLINTLSGMSIDIMNMKPKLGAVTGGLSGPAVRPVAVKMVWDVFQKVNIPIIGMGGISDTESALEFMIAGATAVSIGTANFINPHACTDIISGIKEYMLNNNIADIKKIVGKVKI